MWMRWLCLLHASSIVLCSAAPRESNSRLSPRAIIRAGRPPNPIHPQSNGSPPDSAPWTPPPNPFVNGDEAPENMVQAQTRANQCLKKCWDTYVAFRQRFLVESYFSEPEELERKDKTGAISCHNSCAERNLISGRYVQMPASIREQYASSSEENSSNDNGSNGNGNKEVTKLDFLGREMGDSFKDLGKETEASASRLESSLGRILDSVVDPSLKLSGGNLPQPGGPAGLEFRI
ncbi:MAG: hypothetical protein M1816_006211 [Peltula sp. TS41687]|nr:MAG: hypothetical protein M1816_006211 [Peltula sp. TS41687]